MPRFTMDIDDNFDKLLTTLAADKGGSKAKVIQDAVTSYYYLKQQTVSKEKKLSFSNQQDVVIQDVELP